MTNGIALKIYESNVESNQEKIITGLRYKRQENENPILTNSLTTCVRFNLKRLGNLNNPGYSNNWSPIIIIPSETYYFLGIVAGYPESWLVFENYNHGNIIKIFKVLLDPVSDSYLIWKLFTWHHICFSYSEQNSQIRFVKVNSSNYRLCWTAFECLDQTNSIQKFHKEIHEPQYVHRSKVKSTYYMS